MRIKRWIWLLAGIAGLLVVLKPGRDPDRREVGVTPQLAGVWRTADARYADRFLEISRGEIVFGQGAAGEERHRLIGVILEETRSQDPLYLVRYRVDDRGERTLDLRLRLRDGVLRIESQPEIAWRR